MPVLVDAGVGTASDAAIAMELGCAGVLMNTAIALARDPVRMARAMRLAVEAGREAFLAGRMPRKLYAASPSSPTSRAHRLIRRMRLLARWLGAGCAGAAGAGPRSGCRIDACGDRRTAARAPKDRRIAAGCIEDVQLKRLPNLAMRDGDALTVQLYPWRFASCFATSDRAARREDVCAVGLPGADQRRRAVHDRRRPQRLPAAAAHERAQLPRCRREPLLSPDRQRVGDGGLLSDRVRQRGRRVARHARRRPQGACVEAATAVDRRERAWKDADTLVVRVHAARVGDKPRVRSSGD